MPHESVAGGRPDRCRRAQHARRRPPAQAPGGMWRLFAGRRLCSTAALPVTRSGGGGDRRPPADQGLSPPVVPGACQVECVADAAVGLVVKVEDLHPPADTLPPSNLVVREPSVGGSIVGYWRAAEVGDESPTRLPRTTGPTGRGTAGQAEGQQVQAEPAPDELQRRAGPPTGRLKNPLRTKGLGRLARSPARCCC